MTDGVQREGENPCSLYNYLKYQKFYKHTSLYRSLIMIKLSTKATDKAQGYF